MRHKGMQQSQCRREHKIHHCQGRSLFRFVRAENISLGRFNKPVAVIAPDKIIEVLGDHVEMIFAIRGLDCVDCLVQASEHFHGVNRYRLSIDFWWCLTRPAHLTKPSDIPELRREDTAFLDLSFIEANVLPSRRDAHQTKSQAVGTVLVDYSQRM